MDQIKSGTNRALFQDSAKMKDLKEKFVRYGVEETLRRNVNKNAKFMCSTSSELENSLFLKSGEFFKKVYGNREAKIKKVYSVESED